MAAAKLFFAAALAAVSIGTVSAQCDEPTITVAAPAEATINCRTVEGDIVFTENDALTGDVDISGPQSIKGSLIVNGTKNLVSLSSSTIGNIGGKFQLQSLERVSSLDFPALKTVGEIEWITLPALQTLNFGTEGVTRVRAVHISDTHLSSLSGLSMVSVGTFIIDNNDRLTEWSTQIANITQRLEVSQNSDQLEVSFPNLIWAKYMELRGIKSLDVPLLRFVNDSLKFDENNQMESFIAPNLTRTGQDVTFINNEILSNVSLPKLERSGSVTIRNNQQMEKIDGFPSLETVDGAVTLKGNFTDAELPKLKDVKGAFNVSSTEDINSVCDTFNRLKSSGDIQGRFNCQPNNENANDGTEGNDSGSSSEDAASLFSVSSSLVIVAALAALMQAL